jgi:hypothetical protein
LAFIQKQKTTGQWKKCNDWKDSYQGIIDKKNYRFVPTIEKFEVEVYKEYGKSWKHCGIMRVAGPDKGKILEKFAKGTIRK